MNAYPESDDEPNVLLCLFGESERREAGGQNQLFPVTFVVVV